MKDLSLLFILFLFSCKNTDTNIPINFPLGGYDFPTLVTNKEVYCYPLLSKISRRDSFLLAYEEAYFFKCMQVPNISLQPAEEPIFRLSFMSFESIVIEVTKTEIVVKTGEGIYSPITNGSKLSGIERDHLKILKYQYPLDEIKPTPKNDEPAPIPPPSAPGEVEKQIAFERRIDSIRKNTPALFNGQYFNSLLKKANTAPKELFTITVKRIPISDSSFRNIVDQINSSGFWNMPFEAEYCSSATDGYTLILEANTGIKYNYTKIHGPCDQDSSKFHKACQDLLRLAGFDSIWVYLKDVSEK